MKYTVKHFPSIGLKNFYLDGGWHEENSDHGKCTSIYKMDDLHDSLAASISFQPDFDRDEFRYLRKYLGLSVSELAKAMGVDEEHIHRQENGVPGSTEKMFLCLLCRHYALLKLYGCPDDFKRQVRCDDISIYADELDELHVPNAVIAEYHGTKEDGYWTVSRMDMAKEPV